MFQDPSPIYDYIKITDVEHPVSAQDSLFSRNAMGSNGAVDDNYQVAPTPMPDADFAL